MRIMVCGSREWWNADFIRGVLDSLDTCPRDSVVMHGDCPDGADPIVDAAARDLGFTVEPYPPSKYIPSPQRYHVRNRQMLDMADQVIAFVLDGAENRGTRSVIKEAERRGIPFRTFEGEASGENVHELARDLLRLWSEEDGTQATLDDLLEATALRVLDEAHGESSL